MSAGKFFCGWGGGVLFVFWVLLMFLFAVWVLFLLV